MNEITANDGKEKDSRDTVAVPPTDQIDNSLDQDRVKIEKIISTAIFVLAVVAAFWFRFHQIGIKPFHHDEGVNSYFLLNLAKEGEYRYDPFNYHGPTLYYLALIPLRIFGETDMALRFWPAMFGTLSVAMLWLLKRPLGTIGTPVAALCMATSPGLVYFSRDFIHEMSFGCFSLGIIIGVWRYVETKKFIWLVLFSVSIGLLVTTKETAVINLAVMIVALLCAVLWEIARRMHLEGEFHLARLVRELKETFAGKIASFDHALSALIMFIFVYIFFYSSLFTHWSGTIDFFRSIMLWASERSNKDHVHPFFYYLGILIKLELPILIGSILGGLFVVRRGGIFWLFMAALTLGTTLAYSIIPYKTPWLMISFLIPLAIMSGYAAEQLYQLLPLSSLRILWLAIIAMAVTAGWQLTWKVNLVDYDDNNNSNGYFTTLGKSLNLKPYIDGQYGYVYAQTDKDIFNLVQTVKNRIAQLPSGNSTGIYMAVPSSDYWPLPWYLRDYPNTEYKGSLNVETNQIPSPQQPIMIAHINQQGAIEKLSGWRLLERSFTLRPGVELMIYTRIEK